MQTSADGVDLPEAERSLNVDFSVQSSRVRINQEADFVDIFSATFFCLEECV